MVLNYIQYIHALRQYANHHIWLAHWGYNLFILKPVKRVNRSMLNGCACTYYNASC